MLFCVLSPCSVLFLLVRAHLDSLLLPGPDEVAALLRRTFPSKQAQHVHLILVSSTGTAQDQRWLQDCVPLSEFVAFQLSCLIVSCGSCQGTASPRDFSFASGVCAAAAAAGCACTIDQKIMKQAAGSKIRSNRLFAEACSLLLYLRFAKIPVASRGRRYETFQNRTVRQSP